jgi:outer membrane protein
MTRPWVAMLLALAASATPALAQSQSPEWIRMQGVAHTQTADAATEALTLDQAIAAAVATNARRTAAVAQHDVAAARRGQARSAWYPHLSARLSGTQLDQDPNFLFPAASITVPASTFVLPPSALTLPANAFGPGFPAQEVTLPVGGAAYPVPAQRYEVPAQDVRLADRTLLTGTLQAMYALYTGGLARARLAQASAGLEVSRHEVREADAALAFDVTRAYWGVILARKLREVAGETRDRLSVTLELTERLYQTGSGQVKKTDYLRHKSMVDSVVSMVAEFEMSERASLDALVTLTGWQGPQPPVLAASDFPTAAPAPTVEAAATAALAANPRLGQVDAGRAAASAGIDAARAGHRPRVGLFASVTRIGNSYDAGMVTPDNRTVWSLGVGVDVPIFAGFRVTHEVAEARAAERRLAALGTALRDGVALEARQAAMAVEKGLVQRAAAGRAYASATENRELHIRAYQDELVETKDVIEAQIMEAILAGQLFKVQFDLVEALARLDFLEGRAGR